MSHFVEHIGILNLILISTFIKLCFRLDFPVSAKTAENVFVMLSRNNTSGKNFSMEQKAAS